MSDFDNTRNIVDRFWKYIDFDQLYKIIGVIMEVDPIARSTVDVLNMDRPLEQHSIGVLKTDLITDRLKYIHSLDNGINVSLESNAFGNPSAKVLVNNKVWITVKKHDDPYTLPPEAIFRKKLARSNPHATPLLDLLNFRIDDPDERKNNCINCIITYKLPNHISVIFPCKRYKH